MQRRLIAVVVVTSAALGCWSGPRSEVTPRLEPFTWMLGDWQNPANAMSVVATPGTIYLVDFQDSFHFDVKLIDETVDGVALIHPMDGREPDRAMKVRPSGVTFVGPDGSTTTLSHGARMGFPDGSVSDSLEYSAGPALVARFQPFHAALAPVVESADLELATAARDHGAVGWAAGFTEDGAIWTAANGWVRGRAAVERALARIAGAWEPTTSRVAPDGKLALTAGRFTTRTSGELERGTYLTIWKRVAKDRWKVVFSTFRSARVRVATTP